MIQRGDYVRLEKKGVVSDPEYRTPLSFEHDFGKDNQGQSLPVDYWITGTLVNEPAEDTRVLIDRDCRNGVKVIGVLTTSVVQKVEELDENTVRFETLNSVYILTKATKDDALN